MFRYIKTVYFVAFFILGALLCQANTASAEQIIDAPTLIEPNITTVTGKVKPLITGLTLSGTFVRVYIDGIYNGKTKVVAHKSGTANFAYKPFLNLAPGQHFIQAVSEDSLGNQSKKSDILNFNIECPMPAPTLFSMEFSDRTGHDRPFIAGVVKNESLVRVFIDHKLDGQFEAKNHKSGVADFAYRPFQPLANGNHFVYVTATDSRGKESIWSNILYFNIDSAVQAVPAQIVADADQEKSESKIEVKGLDSEKEAKENVVIEDYQETGSEVEIQEITDDEIKEIMEEEIVKEEDEKGLINESKQKQGGLNLNLIIFLVFLFGIIAWIFWVNKELIKERREQAEKEKNSGDWQ